MPNPAHKHHYIPVFFTKWWAGSDGCVQRYTKHTKVIERRVHPSRVGWQDRLYELPLESTEQAQFLEETFFRQLDNIAAVSLRKLNADPVVHMSAAETTAWSIFMMSLLHRTPHNLSDTLAAGQRLWEGELLSDIRNRYAELRQPDDPGTFEQYMALREPLETDNHTLRNLPNLITNPRICGVLNECPWVHFPVPTGVNSLLLSDNPLARTNGIMNPQGHLAIPLSPRRLLVVAPDRKTLQQFDRIPIRQLVKAMNRWTVESAQHFVVAVDRSQEVFIERHFGSEPKPSLHSSIGSPSLLTLTT